MKNSLGFSRALVIGFVTLIIIMGLIFLIRLAAVPEPNTRSEKVNSLASSDDQCVECHRQSSPGIVQQYGISTMAAAKVKCQDCHEVSADYPGAVEHEGTYVLQSPTSAMCQRCHQAEVAQFNQSRHGLPAYVAVFGSKDLSPDLLAAYQAIPEGSFAPDKSRNIIAEMEGQDITRFACETCHNIGRPSADQSVGRCQSCHLRHEFSLEQVRKPETCNACHIGPDHPQWEIYQESPHGIAYATGGDNWNWDADMGTLTVEDFPAPTCAICHMSGFGGTSTTHDVGDRLSWYLFAPISERRPAYQDNIVKMQSVCYECHNQTFIKDFYADADKATMAVNGFVEQGDQILQPLKDKNLLTSVQFDEPIDFVSFELWHHWGRTAKFGTWMQGPDYVQWHGAYEMLKSLSEMHEMAEDKLSGKDNNMYLLAEVIPWIKKIKIPLNRDQAILLLAAINEIFLGADIYLAHYIDGIIKPYEWIPILFGPIAGVLLIIAGLLAIQKRTLANIIATFVFLGSVTVGVLGSYFHLNRALLFNAPAGQKITTDLLVWGPPLLGPLTFILVAILGISAAWIEEPVDSGIVRLIGKSSVKMPLSKTRAYFFMVALFFLVTLLSSVLDHSRVNFENFWLWIPTIVGIFAVAVTTSMGIFNSIERSDLITYIVSMILMILVGLIGAWLHIQRNLSTQDTIIIERFLRGAPVLAPMLFANMGLLGLLVLLNPSNTAT